MKAITTKYHGQTIQRLTFDSVTGKIVRAGQSESFTCRFYSADCVWNGDEWVPIDIDAEVS